MTPHNLGMTCAWCGGECKRDWLCEHCDRTPWYAGGARFVLRKLWYEHQADHLFGKRGGKYRLAIVDRAYCHREVRFKDPVAHSSRGYQQRTRCRDLNRWHQQQH